MSEYDGDPLTQHIKSRIAALTSDETTVTRLPGDGSECPICGEWRDSPTADCANCGYDVRPAPHALWQQANGDRDEYLRLMREHGHLVPGKRPPGEDIFGHAAWRTPSVGSLDLDTLLYVRESIAGIVDVDRGRPFNDALPLIDEIIRLRAAMAAPPSPVGLDE